MTADADGLKASNGREKKAKPRVPADLLRRMQTEHGSALGFRMIVIGNFFSYEPHATILADYGLLEDDMNVLANLRDWGGMTAQVICALTGRPKNSMSRAVVRLIDGGYIRSAVDEGDRRRAILTITDTGRALFEKAAQPFREQEEKMFGCLTKKETEQLDTLLLKILRNWSSEFTPE